MNENRISLLQRYLEDDPINNDESQEAEKSENIHFLADFINIPIVFRLVKGQLISKCPYEKSVSSKMPMKIFLNFCPDIICSFLRAFW